MVTDALATLRRTHLCGRGVLLRADSAFYSHAMVTAALRAGADVSVTVRMDPVVKRAIAAIPEEAWESIKYTNAIYDEDGGAWISTAQVAEVPFTAFTSKKTTEQVPGRLVVRRIPELNPKADQGQPTLFDVWRFHAFFTTTPAAVLATVAADQTHRRHAVIEQVHADLKASALGHLPPGSSPRTPPGWCAPSWRSTSPAAATLTQDPGLRKATTPTIRRKLVCVPARIARSARRLRLHLPTRWPWQTAWQALYEAVFFPAPAPAT